MTLTPKRTLWLMLAASLVLPGCKYAPELPGVTPYRMEIQQGNFVSQDMVDKLKPGMTREQVRFVLGTPLLADIFHADRWDYVYFRELANGKREQRRLLVRFKDDKLSTFEGDAAPAPVQPAPAPAASAAPAADPKRLAAPVPVAKAREATPGTPAATATAPVPEKSAPSEGASEKAAPSERGFFGRLIDKLGF